VTGVDVRIVRTGDPPPFPELADQTVHYCVIDKVVVLQGGTAAGRSTVALMIQLPDGSWAMAETTARLFEVMAAAVRGACQSWGEDNR
jgi:chloramphenicol 3-O-phosphotransferase